MLFGPKKPLFRQSGCSRAKVVVIGQKWLCSGKSGCIRARCLYLDKVVRFGQKWLYSGKFVVFGKSSCVWAKVVLFRAKVVVFEKKWLYSGKVVVMGQSGFFGKNLL